MNNKQRAVFMAESLSKVIDRHSHEYRAKNEKLMKEILERNDTKKYTELMAGVIMESIKVMEDWEKSSLPELEGLSPEQYYSSLKTSDDIIEMVSSMIEKNKGILPPLLAEYIKKLDENIIHEIMAKINSIIPDEEGKLNPVQKAELKIVETVALEECAEPLSRLLLRLDTNATDNTIEYVMDALKSTGKSAIPCLIASCEKSGHKGNIYANSITTLAEIASSNKSEEIYRYLKECFRKSSDKLVEAVALGIYGDGRAIAAIRGYVERNIHGMDENRYSMLRDVIIRFGGIVSDLDMEFAAHHHH